MYLGLATLASADTANIDIPYTTGNAPLIIEAAAAHYAADGDALLRTAKCESSLENAPRHWDVNGYAYGPFQFHTKTFYTNAGEMRLPDPDITDPTQQTMVAAYMFSKGESYRRQWTCYRRGSAP